MLNTKAFGFLSKQHIRHASEFDAIFKRGKRVSSGCFVLRYLKIERDYSRLGMVISKRQCALAVNRNRIKRVIREQFRLKQHALQGIDLVVLLKSSTKKIRDQEQAEWLEKLFSQLIVHCSSCSSN